MGLRLGGACSVGLEVAQTKQYNKQPELTTYTNHVSFVSLLSLSCLSLVSGKSSGVLASPLLSPSLLLSQGPPPVPLSSPSPPSFTSIPVGLGRINSLEDLRPLDLPTHTDPCADYYTRRAHGSTYIHPRLSRPRPASEAASRSSSSSSSMRSVNRSSSSIRSSSMRAFLLDSQEDHGAVVLLYNATVPLPRTGRDSREAYGPCASPTVWYVDRTMSFHFLCDDFSSYLRLLTVHLGIKGWWALFGTGRIWPEGEEAMRRFAPERLAVAMGSGGG